MIDRNPIIEVRFSFVQQIIAYLNSKNIAHNISSTLPTDLCESNCQLGEAWIALTNYRSKIILPKPRPIHKATKFDDSVSLLPQEYQDKVAKIIEQIKRGEDINSLLTTQMFDSECFDNLLNQWGIKHLHISDIVEVEKAQMHGNRSSYLLFAVFNDDGAYLLNVESHPHGSGFSAYHFLETLHENNWMDLVGFHVMDGVTDVQPHIESDDDIHFIFKAHVNSAFMFGGVCYMSFGVTWRGNKAEHSMMIGKVKATIDHLGDDARFIGFSEVNGVLEFLYRNNNELCGLTLNV